MGKREKSESVIFAACSTNLTAFITQRDRMNATECELCLGMELASPDDDNDARSNSVSKRAGRAIVAGG